MTSWTRRGAGVASSATPRVAIRLRAGFSPLASRVRYGPGPFASAAFRVASRSASGRITTPLPSTDTTSTVASGHGWGTTPRENASMSAAAATVSSSTPRLPTTCPQRRVIVSVAWSNEPHTATLGGQSPQPVAVAQPGQAQRRIGRVDVAAPSGTPGTPAHHDRPEDAGQQPLVAGLDRTAGDAVGAGHRCRPLADRPLLTEPTQLKVVLEQLPQQLPTPRLQQLLQLAMPQPGGRLGVQLHNQGIKHAPGGGKRIGRGGGAGLHRLSPVGVQKVGGVDAATLRPPPATTDASRRSTR